MCAAQHTATALLYEKPHVGFAHSSPGRTVSSKRREQRGLPAALAVSLWYGSPSSVPRSLIPNPPGWKLRCESGNDRCPPVALGPWPRI